MSVGKVNRFDEATLFLGDYGVFQVALIFCLGYFSVSVGYMDVVIVFVSDTPEFHCKVNEKLIQNSSNVLEQRFSSSSTGPDSCSRYRESSSTETALNNETEPCAHGWDFSTEVYTATTVSEWELVCDNAWKVPLSTSFYFVGVMTGQFVCGFLSDRFGRKPILFSTIAIQTIAALIQTASVNWVMFTMLNCLRGFGQASCLTTSVILGSEILSSKARVIHCLLGQNLGLGIGYALIPLLAYFINNWRMLLLACSIPGFFVIPLWWFIPESPQWLLQKKRLKEAEAVICRVAKMNKVSPPAVIFTSDRCLLQTSSHEGNYSCWDLVRTTNIRIITLIGTFIWFTVVMVYYGLYLNSSSLNGSKYINYFILAAIDIAVYIMTWLMINRVSRPIFLFSSFMFSGILLLVIQLVPEDMDTVFLGLALSARIGLSCAYTFIYMFSLELMPVVLRHTGLGIFTTTGRIGSILCPYINYLGNYNKSTPFMIFGTFSVIASVFSLFLPDTRHRQLPTLITDVQSVQRHCCQKTHKRANSQEEDP